MGIYQKPLQFVAGLCLISAVHGAIADPSTIPALTTVTPPVLLARPKPVSLNATYLTQMNNKAIALARAGDLDAAIDLLELALTSSHPYHAIHSNLQSLYIYKSRQTYASVLSLIAPQSDHLDKLVILSNTASNAQNHLENIQLQLQTWQTLIQREGPSFDIPFRGDPPLTILEASQPLLFEIDQLTETVALVNIANRGPVRDGVQIILEKNGEYWRVIREKKLPK